MASGYIPPTGEPGPDEILDALSAAFAVHPGLAEAPADEVSRLLAAEGYLEREPSPPLVAEALGTIAPPGDDAP